MAAPQQPFFYWMEIGETPISQLMIWNHPIETTILKWMANRFQVLVFLPWD